MMPYAFLYTPGPNWLKGKPVTDQPLEEHLAYMKALYAQGVLLIGGPLMDHTGGLVVINAHNDEEAQRLLNADPAIQSKICLGTAHCWSPLLNRYTGEQFI